MSDHDRKVNAAARPSQDNRGTVLNPGRAEWSLGCSGSLVNGAMDDMNSATRRYTCTQKPDQSKRPNYKSIPHSVPSNTTSLVDSTSTLSFFGQAASDHVDRYLTSPLLPHPVSVFKPQHPSHPSSPPPPSPYSLPTSSPSHPPHCSHSHSHCSLSAD